MLFVDGNNTGIQLIDAVRIDIRANYIVARFREARGSHQSHITATDYANMQGETPFKQSEKRGDTALNGTAIIIAECRAERHSTSAVKTCLIEAPIDW